VGLIPGRASAPLFTLSSFHAHGEITGNRTSDDCNYWPAGYCGRSFITFVHGPVNVIVAQSERPRTYTHDKICFTIQERSVKPSAHIELVPATAGQEPILANLLELYTYDFSEQVCHFAN
jgi:hypothetical protein